LTQINAGISDPGISRSYQSKPRATVSRRIVLVYTAFVLRVMRGKVRLADVAQRDSYY
jgi:hypothetical protein